MSNSGFLPVRHHKKSLLLPVCMRRSNQTKRRNRTAERRHDRLSVIGTEKKSINQGAALIYSKSCYSAYEAGRCASIHTALGIKAEQFSRQHTGKYSVLMRAVEQTGGRLSTVIARKKNRKLIISSHSGAICWPEGRSNWNKKARNKPYLRKWSN